MGNYSSYASSSQTENLGENEKEFTEILSLLMDTDLTVLYQVLLVDEKEQHGTLRKLRDNISVYSQLYNAYTARFLVLDPILYVKNEMVRRFTGLNEIK